MPLQLLVYHLHDAPVPKLPPDTVNVVELPEVTEAGFAVAEVGAVELVQPLTVTVAFNLPLDNTGNGFPFE